MAEQVKAVKSTSKKVTKTSEESTSAEYTKDNLPFEVGSYIFYPHEGLGFINKLEEREFNGENTLYYEIAFQSQKMISRIPVKSTKILKLRKVISKVSAQKVLRILATRKDQSDISWKDRLNLYQEILKKGNATEMAEIVSSLYLRKKIKPLSFQERQCYEFSLESLIGEVSVAMSIERNTAEEMINDSLSKVIEDVE